MPLRSLNEIFDPSKARDLEFANSSRSLGTQTVQIRPEVSGTLPSPRWMPLKFRNVRLTGISQTFQFFTPVIVSCLIIGAWLLVIICNLVLGDWLLFGICNLVIGYYLLVWCHHFVYSECRHLLKYFRPLWL
jgi:hypothetical protein